MRTSSAWLPLNHGGGHPTAGDLLLCTGPGQWHLVRPGLLVVGPAGGGMIFVCTGLWHTVFLQPGRPFLSHLYSVFVLKGSDQLSLPTAVPFRHSYLLSRCPSSGSHKPLLPTAGANQTGVSWCLLAFLPCVPNTMSST